MKAPEKLYLRKRNKLPLEVVRDKWYETDPQSLYGSIEYTRTDAFIKKAWEWVDMHFHETEVDDRWGESRCVVMSRHDVFKDDLLKDFKNYMKGE